MNQAGSAEDQSKGATGEARRRVLLVDDHPFMRAGLALLIDKQPDMVVAAEAGNPAEAMRVLASEQIDLILSDITMPGRSGIDFIKDLQATNPELPILVVSMHDETLYAERVLRAGARAQSAPYALVPVDDRRSLSFDFNGSKMAGCYAQAASYAAVCAADAAASAAYVRFFLYPLYHDPSFLQPVAGI